MYWQPELKVYTNKRCTRTEVTMNADDFRTHLSLASPPCNGPVISHIINPLMSSARCVWGASGAESWRERERQEGREGEGTCVRRGARESDSGVSTATKHEGLCPREGSSYLVPRSRNQCQSPRPSLSCLQGMRQESASGAPTHTLALPPPVCRSSGKLPLQ